MFVVLDTNHFAELVHDTVLGGRLKARFQAEKAQVFTTIITAQEVTEGWCAFIRKQKAGTTKQIHGYTQFQHSLELLMALTVLAFDEQAAVIITSTDPTNSCLLHGQEHAQAAGLHHREPARGEGSD